MTILRIPRQRLQGKKPVWSSLQKISQKVGQENHGHAGREPTGQPEMFFSSWTQILFWNRMGFQKSCPPISKKVGFSLYNLFIK
jgi:hypothetical protein